MSIGTRISNRLKRGRSGLARKFAKLAGHKVWLKEIDGVGTVKIRFNSTDELTFQHVFLNKEYDISRLRQYQQISET